MSSRKPKKGESLAEVNPKLAKDWHPTKNGSLTPWDVFPSASKKVWWKCNKGDDHEWEASTNARIGRGCPVCAGKKVVLSNCMLSTHPELAKQFHPTKNGSLTPKNILGTYSKKVWWKCDKGDDHEWEVSPENRARGTGCAICAGKKVVKSNCLSTTHPKIASQWHPTKNGRITPNLVHAGSSKKIWWKCNKGPDHVWQTSPVKRTNGRNCPFCSGRKVSLNNNLKFCYPELLDEWDYKNNPLPPDKVYAGGKKKYWWICERNSNHRWQASIGKRGQAKRGCPFCSGRQTNFSNNLPTMFPEIAKEWDYSKNENIDINSMYHGSETKVWWKCNKGPDHEWKALVSNRTRLKVGCPICNGKMVVLSNCLSTTHPKIASQWHPTKNGKLTPLDVVIGSGKKIWWKCNKGPDHEWRTKPAHRLVSGCPYCTLTPQSKQELIIAHELITIFENINPKGFKTKVKGKLRSIDIYIPRLKLGIEFDGSHWHKDKRALDKLKTEELEEEGFNIIRIRQKPLKRIFEDDVMAEKKYDGKQITNDLLKQIMKDFDLDKRTIRKIENYIKKPDLQNEKGLDKYIDMILEEKANKKK